MLSKCPKILYSMHEFSSKYMTVYIIKLQQAHWASPKGCNRIIFINAFYGENGGCSNIFLIMSLTGTANNKEHQKLN